MDACASGSPAPPATCRIPPGARCPPTERDGRSRVTSQPDIMFIRNKETTMKKVLLYVLVAVAAAACASKETRDTQPQVGAGGNTTQPQRPSPQPTGMADAGTLGKRSVYFDFDSNAVKDEYRSVVTAHSRNMTDKRG